MGFGFADLVVAVPAFWIDVDRDGRPRRRRGAVPRPARPPAAGRDQVPPPGPRPSSSGHGVANYLLVDSQGATEGAVKNRTAEAVADITTTGATLRDNHLRVLDDGLILRSQATLFARARSAAGHRRHCAALARLRARLGQAAPAVGRPAAEGISTAGLVRPAALGPIWCRSEETAHDPDQTPPRRAADAALRRVRRHDGAR